MPLASRMPASPADGRVARTAPLSRRCAACACSNRALASCASGRWFAAHACHSRSSWFASIGTGSAAGSVIAFALARPRAAASALRACTSADSATPVSCAWRACADCCASWPLAAAMPRCTSRRLSTCASSSSASSARSSASACCANHACTSAWRVSCASATSCSRTSAWRWRASASASAIRRLRVSTSYRLCINPYSSWKRPPPSGRSAIIDSIGLPTRPACTRSAYAASSRASAARTCGLLAKATCTALSGDSGSDRSMLSAADGNRAAGLTAASPDCKDVEDCRGGALAQPATSNASAIAQARVEVFMAPLRSPSAGAAAATTCRPRESRPATAAAR